MPPLCRCGHYLTSHDRLNDDWHWPCNREGCFCIGFSEESDVAYD